MKGPDVFLFLGLIVAVLGIFALVHQRDELRQQAIDRGHAEWRIIPGTSETEFKWKDDQ